MEVIGFFFLLICFLFLRSSSSSSSAKVQPDPEFQQWISEFQNSSTHLNFLEWKSEKKKKALELYVEKEKQKFDELVEIGKEKQHILRQGTVRKHEHVSLNEFANSFGIHPDEVALIKRKDELKSFLRKFEQPIIRHRTTLRLEPLRPEKTVTVTPEEKPKLTDEERVSTLNELTKIEFEWCKLNSRLLDDFYFETTKDIGRNDFVVTYYEPHPQAKFPFCAGTWEAKSRKWALRHSNGSTSPISSSSPSRNAAIAFALADIETKRATKHVVPAHFEPMDEDL